MKCYLNPNLYIEFSRGKCLITEYETRRVYELSNDYVARLLEINQSGLFRNDAIDQDLLSGKIIGLKPFKNEAARWPWDSASKIFHYSTKDVHIRSSEYNTIEEFAQFWLKDAQSVWKKKIPDILPPRTENLPVIKLPKSKHKQLSLWPILAKRKTSRSFDGKSITLSQLSTLLFTTFGKQPHLDKEHKIGPMSLEKTLRLRRTSPSGGSLQSTMPYVVALRVEGLKPGFYFYDFLHHNLKLIKEVTEIQLGKMMACQYFVDDLSAGVFMTTRLDRMSYKYHDSKAFKVLLLDIGHLSQTLLLTATELGLQTWLSGAMSESLVEKTLEIDTRFEQVMFFVGLGKGNNSALHPAQIRAIKELNNKPQKK